MVLLLFLYFHQINPARESIRFQTLMGISQTTLIKVTWNPSAFSLNILGKKLIFTQEAFNCKSLRVILRREGQQKHFQWDLKQAVIGPFSCFQSDLTGQLALNEYRGLNGAWLPFSTSIAWHLPSSNKVMGTVLQKHNCIQHNKKTDISK